MIRKIDWDHIEAIQGITINKRLRNLQKAITIYQKDYAHIQFPVRITQDHQQISNSSSH